jgi:CRISPR-associated endonuclease/helicase Cas3
VESWAKIRGPKLLSLAHHSTDVACVFRRLVTREVTRARLAFAAQKQEIENVTLDRLAVLAFLHDFGKANHGFQARIDPRAPLIGHLRQTRWLFQTNENLGQVLLKACGLLALKGFREDTAMEFIEAMLAHHGKPVSTQEGAGDRELWTVKNGKDPLDALTELGSVARLLFPKAFEEGGEEVPDTPAFIHAFAGLLNLADWIGSDERVFPVCDEGNERFNLGWQRADHALERMGALAASDWPGMGTDAPAFATAFKGRTPRPFQQAVAEAEGRIVAVEAETGAGKTEAALWRFIHLAARGEVDGLYFALPTRVAARQLHSRVEAMAKAIWPDNSPLVVLATPGEIDAAHSNALQSTVGEGRIILFDSDGDQSGIPDCDPLRLWATERPKRYLTAAIAVGTIDQALLSCIRVKHAHLRATGLLGKLLVIDEVHASDTYMTRLTLELLHRHQAIGGHALLLSATLGAKARSELLTAPGTSDLQSQPPPPLTEAIAKPYPSIAWTANGCENLRAAGGSGQIKRVHMTLAPLLDDAPAIANSAVAHASAGARVLIVRNTVDAAIAVFEQMTAILPGNTSLLFRVNGVATLHHGRFSREDRALMDQAVDATLGKDAPRTHGVLLVGTQTLEQSLDIDADFLITDLCPADVLLQRIGRLHRHARSRPTGFEDARVLVLGPQDDLALYLDRPKHGLGLFAHKGIPQGGIYENLLAVEATRRLILSQPSWDIPAMNRELVEMTTHPQALGSLLVDLAASDARWEKHQRDQSGLHWANRGSAAFASLNWTKPFSECRDLAWSGDEMTFATRLGLDGRVVEFEEAEAPVGPFGVPMRRITIPARWTGVLDPAVLEPWRPLDIAGADGEVAFTAWGQRFGYDARGLRRIAL